VRILSNDDVERLLPMPECIAALEQLYRDYADGQALHVPRLDSLSPSAEPDAYYAFKQMGGAWPRRRLQALRINSDVIAHPTVAGAPRRVKQPMANGRWVGLVFLFSMDTGALLAIMPDGVMQRLRVGAANGIALARLAREDARTLGIIGTGWQAGAQLMAALATRPFQDVRVFSPHAERRQAFVAEARARYPGVGVRSVETADACVDGADVIMAATSSMVPVLQPAWLRPGVHVSCIKAQEVDQALLDACDRVVVHATAQPKQSDHIMPGTPHVPVDHERGWWNAPGSRFADYADLPRLVAGRAPGRTGAGEITCFVNNVGIGLQFAALGALVLDKARREGLGHDLPDDWFTESVHP